MKIINKEEAENLMNIIPLASNVAIKLKNTNEFKRIFSKTNKQNFNFFSAIVSGKHSKDHYEKYHSNFISFLLNPNANHDCDSLFLNLFLQEIRSNFDSFKAFAEDEKQLNNATVEREKPALGNIDIVIESSRNKWMIFIENKIHSSEGNNQVCDYCEWAEKTGLEWLGVYLTKYGSKPNCEKYEKRIILLSYSNIINWLKKCIEHDNVTHTPIKFAIEQYIGILNKILMVEKDQTKNLQNIEKIFTENMDSTIELIKNNKLLQENLELYIKEKRVEFLSGIENLVTIKLRKENIECTNLICRYNEVKFEIKIQQEFPKSDQGRGLWWGIYLVKDGLKESFNFELYKKFHLTNRNWESIRFRNLEDLEINTDEGSALIVKSSYDPNLRDELLTEITEHIVDNTLRIKQIIVDNN